MAYYEVTVKHPQKDAQQTEDNEVHEIYDMADFPYSRYGSYMGKDDFFHSLIQQIFIAHHVLGTVLGSGNRTTSKTDRNPCPHGAYILLEKTEKPS